MQELPASNLGPLITCVVRPTKIIFMIQSAAAALKQLKAAAEFLTSSLKMTSKAVVTRVKIMTIKQTSLLSV